MRLNTLAYLSVLAVGLACGPKLDPADSASDATGDPASTTTTTTAPSTEGTTEPGTTSTVPPTEGTTEPVIEPTPCEDEAAPIEAAAIANVVVPDGVPCGSGEDSVGTGCWEGPPADSLWVHLASELQECGAPPVHPACGNWDLGFVLRPEFQVPGLYHLTGPAIVGNAVEVDANPGEGGECETRWETLNATLEIISVDETGVTGRLCHVDSPLYADDDINLEGSFFAPRCG
jgi:hypothetical protein